MQRSRPKATGSSAGNETIATTRRGPPSEEGALAKPIELHGVVTELLAPDDPPSSSTGPACEAAAGPAAAAEAEALAAAAAQERHPGAEAARGFSFLCHPPSTERMKCMILVNHLR